jgi:hypothetical protein
MHEGIKPRRRKRRRRRRREGSIHISGRKYKVPYEGRALKVGDSEKRGDCCGH